MLWKICRLKTSSQRKWREHQIHNVSSGIRAVSSHLGVQAGSLPSLPTSSSKILRKDHLNASEKDQKAPQSAAGDIDTDIITVGASFGGTYLLHRLRDELGFNVECLEAGKDIGGISIGVAIQELESIHLFLSMSTLFLRSGRIGHGPVRT